jgi:hypothetical protein
MLIIERKDNIMAKMEFMTMYHLGYASRRLLTEGLGNTIRSIVKPQYAI